MRGAGAAGALITFFNTPNEGVIQQTKVWVSAFAGWYGGGRGERTFRNRPVFAVFLVGRPGTQSATRPVSCPGL